MSESSSAVYFPDIKVGYARVSTEKRVLHLQLDALEKAGCERVFEDHAVSGASVIEPALESALDSCGRVTLWSCGVSREEHTD